MLYGSARVLLRRLFEMLMISKYIDYNLDQLERWEKGEIQMKIVWNYLETVFSKQDLKYFKSLYKGLSKCVHATPYAQQPIFLVKINEEIKEELEITIKRYKGNIMYTLDLTIILIGMYMHVLNRFHNTCRRWYLGYYYDPFGWEKDIKVKKKEIRQLMSKYLDIMKEGVSGRKLAENFRKLIFIFRKDWSKGP